VFGHVGQNKDPFFISLVFSVLILNYGTQLFGQLCHPLYRLEEIVVFPYIVMKLAFETKGPRYHIFCHFPIHSTCSVKKTGAT